MISTLSPPDMAPAAPLGAATAPAATGDVSGEDRTLVLPGQCTTVHAQDIGVRLVLAADFDGDIVIDASGVESIGHATLQLLVAAHADAIANGHSFTIAAPSPAFVERVTACRLADAIGLDNQKEIHS